MLKIRKNTPKNSEKYSKFGRKKYPKNRENTEKSEKYSEYSEKLGNIRKHTSEEFFLGLTKFWWKN